MGVKLYALFFYWPSGKLAPIISLEIFFAFIGDSSVLVQFLPSVDSEYVEGQQRLFVFVSVGFITTQSQGQSLHSLFVLRLTPNGHT